MHFVLLLLTVAIFGLFFDLQPVWYKETTLHTVSFDAANPRTSTVSEASLIGS